MRDRPPDNRERGRDRGAILPVVLVLMVVGTLIIVPLLTYSITVFKANRVVSDNTARTEAARAGLRMALADPVETFERCGAAGLNTPVGLPGPGLDITTTTTCNLLEVASARDDTEVPYAIAHTWFGEPPAAGSGLVGDVFAPTLADEAEWIEYTSSDGLTVPDTGDPTNLVQTVWTPDLPVHSLSLRSPIPYELADGYAFAPFATCRVYFPGTYTQPLTISGPTYFASGVYYFEDEVRIVANTDPSGEATSVLAGQGTLRGCVGDQYAVFYSVDAPAGHNVSALGATFVFGDEGRLVLDDTDGPVTFRMNQRYVPDDDEDNLPSRQVSIMTVNGAIDEVSGELTDLEVAGQLSVLRSLVGDPDGDRLATDDGYLPSVLTPAPRPPGPPDALAADARDAGVVFSWAPPDSSGGELITSYRVDATDPWGGVFSCSTTTATACSVAGLGNDITYTATAVAITALGESEPSDEVTFVPRWSDPDFDDPSEPRLLGIIEAEVPVDMESRWSDAFEVTWTAPDDDGDATIDAYEVEVSDGTDVFTCATDGATTCVVAGLTGYAVTDTFSIRVRARNIVAWSDWAEVGGFRLLDTAPTYVAPDAPTADRHSPPAVFEIESTSSHRLEVFVPGHIATPQGRISVSTADPTDKHVSLSGGVLAAWTDISDPRPADFTLGLLNPTTQRVVRIHTAVDGTRVYAEAIVQVNETGAWAVNSWTVS